MNLDQDLTGFLIIVRCNVHNLSGTLIPKDMILLFKTLFALPNKTEMSKIFPFEILILWTSYMRTFYLNII